MSKTASKLRTSTPVKCRREIGQMSLSKFLKFSLGPIRWDCSARSDVRSVEAKKKTTSTAAKCKTVDYHKTNDFCVFPCVRSGLQHARLWVGSVF